MNIKEILKKSNELLTKKNIDESILKSRILLANVLNVKKEYLITHDDEEIPKNLEVIFFENLRETFARKANTVYN